MSVTCEAVNGVGLVRVDGPLTATTADEFRRAFWPWYPTCGCRNVIADLGGVDMMDSTGLGILIGALKLAGEQGGDLKIARLQKRPRLVFEITRSYKVFEIFETVEEAVKASA